MKQQEDPQEDNQQQDDPQYAKQYALILIHILTKTHQDIKKLLDNIPLQEHTKAQKQIQDQLQKILQKRAIQAIQLSNQKQHHKPTTPTKKQLNQLKEQLNAPHTQKRIQQYTQQYLYERQKLNNKPLNYYHPNVEKTTLQYAKKKAQLPKTHKSSINNIKALTDHTIVHTYNQAELNTFKSNGITHYQGMRTTTYPCSLCDDLCSIIHPITEQVFPAHPRCQCIIIPILSNLKET